MSDPTKSPLAAIRGMRNLERLVEVEARLLECRSHGEIGRILSRKWGCSERTVQRYMRTVYQEWARRREEDPTDDREIHRQALGRVYRESMKTGKFIAATMALRERSHLMGLHVERMELAGPGGGPVRMEVEDVRAEVARKLDRLAAAGAARGAAGKPDPTGS